MNIYKNTSTILVLGLMLYLPSLLYAADGELDVIGKPPPAPGKFSTLACYVVKIALDFVPLIIVFAVFAFFMGLIKYVGSGDNEEKRSEGRKMMVYGTLGFFFMVGIWGMLRIFVASYGLDLVIPQFSAGGKSFTEACPES